jgi:hypothetical protein
VDLNGKPVHKATFLRYTLEALRNPDSTDRLKRVAALNKFNKSSTIEDLDAEAAGNEEGAFVAGDPAATILLSDGLPFLAVVSIHRIQIGPRTVHSLAHSHLTDMDVRIHFQVLHLVSRECQDGEDSESIGSRRYDWHWDRQFEKFGKLVAPIYEYPGRLFVPINPDMSDVADEHTPAGSWLFTTEDLRGLSLLAFEHASKAQTPLMTVPGSSSFPYRCLGALF